MYKLLLALATLVIAGVGLTLALPQLEPSASLRHSSIYTVDQKSESSPIPINDFYLKTPLPKDAKFTLQLGMYTQLTQAEDFIKTLPHANDYIIIKATDNHRFWYLALKGNYPSQEKALFDQHRLQEHDIPSSLRLLSPVQKK